MSWEQRCVSNMAYMCTALFGLWITMAGSSEKTAAIPNHLLDCYSRPAPVLLPMTMDNMIQIIRKISFNSYASLSLTQQIADVLSWFSIDGLEKNPNILNKPGVVPFHQIGFQAYKQNLILQTLIPIKRRNFEAYSLTVSEKCTLHFMVSATVDYWERGDESKVCPNSPQEFRNATVDGGTGRFSVCPLEGGVVLTSRGSVSASHLLTGLIAALIPQQVSLSQLMIPEQLMAARLWPADTINNVWAATLAGDLAEVAAEQSPQYNMNVNIGITERWNDTYIPSLLYFHNVPFTVIEHKQWQITDAEILGGIDGLLLGSMILKWKQHKSEIRLSQLLEMYYSSWRLTEDHVCNRKPTFDAFIRDNQKTLIEQTERFAALLTTKTTTYYTDSKIMAYRCNKAIEKFMVYYPGLLVEESCPLQETLAPTLNLVVLLDATWPPYSTLQFLMSLALRVDISYYGGSITIINGDSSQVRVNSTSDPSVLYQQMKYGSQNGTGTLFTILTEDSNSMYHTLDPKGLVLQKSFLTLKNLLEENNEKEHALEYPRRGMQDVAVVLGYSSTISDKDLKESKDILQTLKNQNPALQFVYVVSPVNAPRFKQLRDHVGQLPADTVVSVDDSNLEHVLNLLQPAIRTDRSLKPAYCKNDFHQWPEVWYNEIITPSQTNSYWIHPLYLRGSMDIVKISFKNYEYGELYVCMSRDEQRGACKIVSTSTEVTHAVLRPCEKSDIGCQPIYFTVSVLQSHGKCAEYECRYPDQVKFSIIVQDLHCIHLNSNVSSKMFPLFSYYSTLVEALILGLLALIK